MRHTVKRVATIRLVGPGGAGKTSTGALLAERLGVSFLDLDRYLTDRVGDIGKYIDKHGYEAYARANVATYCSVFHNRENPGVVALSSGFMTYACDVHPEYLVVRTEIEQNPTTFVLLPSLDLEVCVAETVRRQVSRPFGRSPAREEAVIRGRYAIYLAIPARKVQTMRANSEVVDEIIAALPPDKRTAADVALIRALSSPLSAR